MSLHIRNKLYNLNVSDTQASNRGQATSAHAAYIWILSQLKFYPLPDFPYIDLFTEFGRKVPGFITYYKLGQCTEFCPLLRFSSELFTQKDVWEEASCDRRSQWYCLTMVLDRQT